MPGPLFSNVVLADEINRASPKTQSALLEAMSERRVSDERSATICPSPSLFWRRRTPTSTSAPSHFPSRSWIDS